MTHASIAKENSRGTPILSIVLSSVLVSVLMIMNYTRGLAGAFKFALLLASMTALIAYLFTAASYIVVEGKTNGWHLRSWTKLAIACLAFIFSIWAIAGSGEEIVYWGFILLMAGIPFYVWVLVKRHEK